MFVLSSRACREIFFYLSFSRSLRENFSSTFLRREESSKEAFPHPRPSPRGRMQTGVADDRRLPCLFGIAGHAIFFPTSLLSPSLGKGLTGPRRIRYIRLICVRFVISSLSRDLFFIFLSVLFSLTPRKGPKEGCYPQGPLDRGMQTGVADDRRLPCLFGIAGHAIFFLTSLLAPSLGKGLTGPRIIRYIR